MDRSLDWAALPAVVELLDVADPALLVGGLVQMREALRD